MSDISFAVEGLLALWLLVKGVDVPRWQEQAAAVSVALLGQRLDVALRGIREIGFPKPSPFWS